MHNIDHTTFLNNKPILLEQFSPFFNLESLNHINEENKKQINMFLSYCFNESLFNFKYEHFMICLNYVKNNKRVFDNIQYYFESSHFSSLLKQVITNNQTNPEFNKIMAELFNPDRFFISMSEFKYTMIDIINYLQSVIKNKNKTLLKLFFSHKYTVDYFYDYHREFLMNINSQFHIPILKSKIFSHIF